MMDIQILISHNVFKAEIIKNVNKAGKSIKKRENKRFKKKLKLNF